MDNKVLVYSSTDLAYIGFGCFATVEFTILISLLIYGIFKSFKIESSFTVTAARLILIPLLLFCLSIPYIVCPFIIFRQLLSIPELTLRIIEWIQSSNFSVCVSQVLYTLADIYFNIKDDISEKIKEKKLLRFKVFLICFSGTQIILISTLVFISNNALIINNDFYFTFFLSFFMCAGVFFGLYVGLIILLHFRINKIVQNRIADEVKRNMKIYTLIPVIIGLSFSVSYVFSDIWYMFDNVSRYFVFRAGIYFLLTNSGCVFPLYFLVFITLKGLNEEVDCEIIIVEELLSGKNIRELV